MNFRTPPSTYIFPDFIPYIFSIPFTDDIARRIFIAAIIQLSAIAFFVTLRYGMIAWCAVYASLLLSPTPIAYTISYHTGCILLATLYLWTKPNWKIHVAALFGFFDPLFLFIPMIDLIFARASIAHTKPSSLLFFVLPLAAAYFFAKPPNN